MAKAELYLNVDPRSDLSVPPSYTEGAVAVEVQDSRGRPVQGFEFARCIPMTTNTAFRNLAGDAMELVRWKGRRRLASLAGRRVRLVFKLRSAHLYGFKAEAPRRRMVGGDHGIGGM